MINYFLISDNACVDKFTGKLWIAGIFDRLGSKNFPAVHATLALVAEAKLNKGDHKYVITLDDPSGETEKITEKKFSVDADTNGHKIITFANGMKFKKDGEHVFRIVIDDEIQKESILKVVKQQ